MKKIVMLFAAVTACVAAFAAETGTGASLDLNGVSAGSPFNYVRIMGQGDTVALADGTPLAMGEVATTGGSTAAAFDGTGYGAVDSWSNGGFYLEFYNATASDYSDMAMVGYSSLISKSDMMAAFNGTPLAGITFTAMSVPEPTSGLLLLVGGALLGLRRKRRVA